MSVQKTRSAPARRRQLERKTFSLFSNGGGGEGFVNQHDGDIRDDRVNEARLWRVEPLFHHRLFATKLLAVFIRQRTPHFRREFNFLQRPLRLRADENREKLGIHGHESTSGFEFISLAAQLRYDRRVRILHLVAGSKWTGTAAVAVDQVRALRAGSIEAEIAIVRNTPLHQRLAAHGWVRPLLEPVRGPLQFLKEVARLRQTLAREPFEILHCHTSHDHILAATAAPRGVLFVRSFHNARNARRDLLSPLLEARCRGVAFANSAIGEIFRSFRPGKVPEQILPPVVETPLFCPGPKPAQLMKQFAIPKDAFVVGTIGKMAPGRGHEAAVRILSRAAERRIVLLQIGKGELRDEIWKLAANLGVGSRNLGTGYQEEILPDCYRAMDAFLFPAAGSEQGHRAVLEALASGLPVISLDIAGIQDLLTLESGIICKTEEEAARALDALARDPSRRNRMSQGAREQALKFSPEIFAGTARDFYAHVIESGKKSRQPAV